MTVPAPAVAAPPSDTPWSESEGSKHQDVATHPVHDRRAIMRTPTDLLAQRHRDYAKAVEWHQQAIAELHAAQERVQTLDRELADAEDADRQALGDALIDKTKPPARKADRARTRLTKAKTELEALQYAAERAGQTLDHMPAERRSDWLGQARTDFEHAGAAYVQALDRLVELREPLAEQAAVIGFLVDGHASIHMAHNLRVLVAGVEGLTKEVPTTDVLDALRDEINELEFKALTKIR
jgi:hypothetical protein